MNAEGARFGRYDVTGVLGSGSFATVYRGRDPLLRREVAIKALYPHLAADAEGRARFLAEARALAGLRHEHIVAVYDVGEAAGRPYFVMELVQGETLTTVLARRGPLPLGEAAGLLAGLASAVDVLHGAGLVHRDITLANVMLTEDGRAMLMDFGIAFGTGSARLTLGSYGLGTPESAAPEQIRNQGVGPPADIYALGVLAYALLAGRPPFTGDTAHVLYAHAHLPPPSLRTFRPDLPLAVDVAVQAALAKEPAARPASALQFIAPIVAAAAQRERGSADVAPDGAAAAVSVAATPRQLVGDTGVATIELSLGRGLTAFHLCYEREGSYRLRARLLAEDGRSVEQFLPIAGPYNGTRACIVPNEGVYRLAVEAAGPWECVVEQPAIARQRAVTWAAASGDTLVYLRLEQGVHRLRLTHSLWRAGFFRASLVDPDARAMDRLVVTTGLYSGVATRRIPEAGVYALVVEATGSWTVAVE